MSPELTLPIAGVVLPAYETLYGLALVGALLFGPRVIACLGGLPVARVRVLVFALTVAAFVGARTFFVATNWSLFAAAPLSAAAVWQGGRNAVAAVATLLVLAPIAVRLAGLPVARFCDAGVPVVAGAYAVARLGCFLHGCCSGAIASCAWCPTFPPRSAPYRVQLAQHVLPPGALRSLPVHPLQLYFAVVAIALALSAVRWNRTKRFDGEVTLGGAVLFALASAALEWLRVDYPGRPHWAGVPVLEWLALSMAVVGGAGLWWCRRRRPLASAVSGAMLVDSAI